MIAQNKAFLKEYVSLAPLALAIERSLECRILSRVPFERPILDIGCGDGIFASVLFDEKIDAGIDPSSVEIEHARKLGSYSQLIQCRGDAIPQPDAKYRTIFANSVLEHIPEIEPVLVEAYRLLSPGGVLYLTVPTDRFEFGSVVSRILSLFHLQKLGAKFRLFYNRFWVHYHCYTPDRWTAIVSGAGFNVETTSAYAPMSVCTLNDLLVPFGFLGFILKRTTNEWTFFPTLRRLMFAPVAGLVDRFLRDADRSEDGGLVFIVARKP
jgi:SAM-dependent methyltransferase